MVVGGGISLHSTFPHYAQKFWVNFQNDNALVLHLVEGYGSRCAPQPSTLKLILLEITSN